MQQEIVSKEAVRLDQRCGLTRWGIRLGKLALGRANVSFPKLGFPFGQREGRISESQSFGDGVGSPELEPNCHPNRFRAGIQAVARVQPSRETPRSEGEIPAAGPLHFEQEVVT
jgi:hypothetical protein